MNPGNFTRTSAMLIVLAMFLLILASAPLTITLTSAEVMELNVPAWVVQGETLSVSGKAAANEEVWIGSSFDISLPVSDGRYNEKFKDIKISGDAAEDATSVNLKVATSIKVIADSTGDFTLDISTEGVPVGEFLITAGGIEKRVEVVLTEPTPTATPAPSSNGGSDSTPSPTLSPSPSPALLPSLSPSPSLSELESKSLASKT